MEFNIGDLVELKFSFLNNGQIGIIAGSYIYSGYRWYKIIWNNGDVISVADVELKLVEVKDEI
jgi:hypothetical protein